MILRSATFFNDLYNDRIPPYLVDAVCALAAPLSKHPLLNVSPNREAGNQFADAALARLLDSESRLKANGVEAAQALVLIQAHKILSKGSIAGELPHFGKDTIISFPSWKCALKLLTEQAFRILHPLLETSSAALPPESDRQSAEIRKARALEREYARRTFWLIHMLELLGAIFTRRTTTYSHEDLSSFSLPCDEASFDLSTFHTSPG